MEATLRSVRAWPWSASPILALVLLLINGCASQDAATSAAGLPAPAMPVQQFNGLKRTIAVGKIDAIPGMSGPYTAASAGPGVAAMLATSIRQSGRFILAERDDLGQVLTEQQLVANRLAQGSAGPHPGAIFPAQYLVDGAVTELSTGDQGSSIGIGVGGFGGLSLNRQKGRVAMDLHLINTRTAEIEDSFSVTKELTSSGVGVTGGYKAITLGGNQFWSTPLGGAMRAALDEAVARISADVVKDGWDALIAQIDGNQVYINAGSDAGLKVGDHLRVERVTGMLTDPATNRVLTVQKANLGTVVITAVDPKFATGTLAKAGVLVPQRGDSVVYEK
jgi:curli biogenesis system outer membrane secretion channel CsgG